MYYLMFVYLLALVLAQEKIPKKYRFGLVMLPFIIVPFLRFGVGADYFSYERIFYTMNPAGIRAAMSSIPEVDILYRIINFIGVKLGMDYHIFSALLSIAITLITAYWMKNNSPNLELSMFLYFTLLYFYWNLSALRQGIALTVLLFVFFNESKPFSTGTKFLITILMIFMHKTAIIVPIVYIMSMLPWNKKFFFGFLLCAPVFKYLLSPYVIGTITSIQMFEKLASYADYNSISYFTLPSLLRFSFSALIWLHLDKLEEKYPEYRKMFNFSLICLIGYFYLPTAMVVGTRVTIFGYFLIIIIFPMIISLYEDRRKLYLAASSIIVFIACGSFYNEFSKLVQRTGYNGTATQLNFETYFNQDRSKFDSAHSFHTEIDRQNAVWRQNNPLSERVYGFYKEIEQEYVPGEQHLMVFFPKYQKFGIINTDGTIVKLAQYDNRSQLFDQYRLIDFAWENFPSIVYQDFGSDNQSVFYYDEIKDIIDKGVSEERSILNSKITVNNVDLDELYKFEVLKGYNRDIIISASEFRYSNSNEYSFIKARTVFGSYYIILYNGEVVANKLYTTIEPLNKDGIVIGRDKYSSDFYNSDGKFIWFE